MAVVTPHYNQDNRNKLFLAESLIYFYPVHHQPQGRPGEGVAGGGGVRGEGETRAEKVCCGSVVTRQTGLPSSADHHSAFFNYI